MKYLTKNKAWDIVEDYNVDKLLYLLIDRPDEIHVNGKVVWKNNKEEWHRNYGLPAIIYKSSDFAWFKNDIHHRENNKPAYIWFDGTKEYWLHGKSISFAETRRGL